MRSRCPDLLDWYRDERGRRLTQEQFGQIEVELSTFYGEAYGYASDGGEYGQHCHNLLSIGNSRPMSARTLLRPIPEDLQSQNVFGLQIGWGQHAGC